MNTPHFTQTIKQRRAIGIHQRGLRNIQGTGAYAAIQHEADAGRQAQIELERLLTAKRAGEEARAASYLAQRERAARCAERVSFERRHGAPVPAPLTGRQLLAAASAWLAVMAATCWLCTDAGMRFLAALWGEA